MLWKKIGLQLHLFENVNRTFNYSTADTGSGLVVFFLNRKQQHYKKTGWGENQIPVIENMVFVLFYTSGGLVPFALVSSR